MAESRQTQNRNQQNEPNAPKTEAQGTQGKGAIEPQRGGGRSLGMPSTSMSPFSFMRRFMGDMDRLFDEFGLAPSPLFQRFGGEVSRGVWAPQIDIFERNNQIVVRADLPGLSQNDVRITLDNDVLTIEGERSQEGEQEREGYYVSERSWGSFRRSIALPQGVSPEDVNASFDNGVLEVSMPLPKGEEPRGRQIPIGPRQKAAGVKH